MLNRLVYRIHAIQRMAERGIGGSDIRRVLENGEVVQSYPDDRPFPSRLMLGFVERRPLHVVVADDTKNRTTYTHSSFSQRFGSSPCVRSRYDRCAVGWRVRTAPGVSLRSTPGYSRGPLRGPLARLVPGIGIM